jgi:hypothetical protein
MSSVVGEGFVEALRKLDEEEIVTLMSKLFTFLTLMCLSRNNPRSTDR